MIRCLTVALMCLLAMIPLSPGRATQSLADIAVVDQDGNTRKFFGDLIRGRTVAIDFFYTTCTSFCRPLSANMREVQDKLDARMGKDIALISISIDPTADTPARLKSFAAQFSPEPGWTFVTGSRPEIARLLRRLGQTLGNPEDHTPLVLVHNDSTGSWAHIDGYDPDAIAAALLTAAGPGPAKKSANGPLLPGVTPAGIPAATPASPLDASAATRAYMTNPTLITQDGRTVRFFDDLMAGRLVLINFMLTSCNAICPTETANLARVQDLLGDRLGHSVVMLSLTVDPVHDRPDQLKLFAQTFGARDGWYFLTGDPGDMDKLAHRLGGYTSDPTDHSSILIAGNVATGAWIKLFAMDDPARIARQVLGLATPP